MLKKYFTQKYESSIHNIAFSTFIWTALICEQLNESKPILINSIYILDSLKIWHFIT